MCNQMKVQFEITDTFCGESNYSWVHQETHELPRKTSRTSLIRMAKKWAGFTGQRCKTEYLGDMIKIKPHGICQVIHILF